MKNKKSMWILMAVLFVAMFFLKIYQNGKQEQRKKEELNVLVDRLEKSMGLPPSR